MTGPLRVLVADDHAPTRAGIRYALEDGGCVVCAEAPDAATAIALALEHAPDVCILDVGMPGSGIHAAAEITGRAPGIGVLMVSVSSAPADLFDSLNAGASGYLLKDMDPAELPAAVRAVAAGEAALPGPLAARLIEEFRHRGTRPALVGADGRGVGLTQREWDVLELIDLELPTAEIARRLFLSPVTVRRHLSNILQKLGAGDRAGARRLLSRGGTSSRLRH